MRCSQACVQSSEYADIAQRLNSVFDSSSTPVTCEGNMLELVWRCGWGVRGCVGASTYFKTWLFVLVKAYCDSSTTGDLSWTQPSCETGALSSHAPSLVAPGPLGPPGRTAASILEESKGCTLRHPGPSKVPIQLPPSTFSVLLHSLRLSWCAKVCMIYHKGYDPDCGRGLYSDAYLVDWRAPRTEREP